MPPKDRKAHVAYNKKWREDHIDQARKTNRVYQRRYRVETKIVVLTHYGPGGRMQCCWPGCEINDPDMLTIDHVFNDGAKDRKLNGSSGSPFFQRLVRDNFPSGFQTLCCNHQWKKEVMRRRENVK